MKKAIPKTRNNLSELSMNNFNPALRTIAPLHGPDPEAHDTPIKVLNFNAQNLFAGIGCPLKSWSVTLSSDKSEMERQAVRMILPKLNKTN
jgi:hypothetical protein